MAENIRYICILNEKRRDILIERYKGISPLDRLKQGFAYVSDKDDNNIKSVDDIKKDDDIYVTFKDGKVKTKVTGIWKTKTI